MPTTRSSNPIGRPIQNVRFKVYTPPSLAKPSSSAPKASSSSSSSSSSLPVPLPSFLPPIVNNPTSARATTGPAQNRPADPLTALSTTQAKRKRAPRSSAPAPKKPRTPRGYWVLDNKLPHVRGSWTPRKELALLESYAEIFPPLWPKGKRQTAWRQVIDAVNSVAPKDVPLGYDACRRAVERLSKSRRDGTDLEKAALEAIARVYIRSHTHINIHTYMYTRIPTYASMYISIYIHIGIYVPFELLD
ncbi:hypothetical protein F4703DRAFT_1867255 [Phycomyces blakesleeanus]